MGILFQMIQRQNNGRFISVLMNYLASSLNLIRLYLLFYETGNVND